MNPLNKFFKSMFKGGGTQKSQEVQDEEALNVGGIESFADKKRLQYIKVGGVILAIFVVIFILNVATKTTIKLAKNTEEDAKGKKVVIPELNLTKTSETKMALLQQAQIDDLNKRLAESERRRVEDSNKTIEAITRLEAELKKQNNPIIRTQNYPAAKLPPMRQNGFQEQVPPPSKRAQLQRIVKQKGSDLDADDFLPPTAPKEVKKPLTPEQLKQAKQPIVTQEAQVKTNNGTQYPHAIQKNSYEINIGSVGMRTSNLSSTDSNATDLHLPNFTTMKGFARATLTSGFKAATLAVGKENPKPVYLSLDSPVLLANGRQMNAEDCILMASAIGDINTGRAEVRLSEMECIVKIKGVDYKVSEKVEGWVYGEDGEFGLKGRLVSPEGKVIDAALPLMAIEAIVGAAKSAGSTTTSTIAGITTTTSNNGNLGSAMKDGAAAGFQKSADKLIDYYIKVLDAMQPSIDVKAGRKVVVAFKGGQKLKVEKFEPLDVNYEQGGQK